MKYRCTLQNVLRANIADLPSRRDSRRARRILRRRFGARIRLPELTPPFVLPPLDAV